MEYIVNKEIKTADILKKVESGEAGAIVSFAGTVRNNAEGKQVIKMDYEANAEMASNMLANLCEDVKSKYPVTAVALQHRTGELRVGEISIYIAVSSPHRADAFSACRYLIDTIKKSVPIWKKEYFTDGSRWVDGQIIESK